MNAIFCFSALALVIFVNSSLGRDGSFPGVTAKEVANMMTKMSDTKPAQWRVTWTGNTSTEATISWSTIAAGKKHILHYCTEAHGKDASKYSKSIPCQVNGNYSIEAKESKQL